MQVDLGPVAMCEELAAGAKEPQAAQRLAAAWVETSGELSVLRAVVGPLEDPSLEQELA